MARHGVERRRLPLLAWICFNVAASFLVASTSFLTFGSKATTRSNGVLWGSCKDSARSRVAMKGLEDITADKRPFLTYEESRPRRRRRINKKEKRRRALENPEPLPEPSADPAELTQQLRKMKKAKDLLEFLSSALRSPGFGASQAALALDLLAIRKPSLRPEELSALQFDPAIVLLARHSPELLNGEDEVASELSINALRGVATFIVDVPQLEDLIKPLARHIVDRVDDTKPDDVANLIWAIAELRDVAPELQNTVLPHFVDTDPRHRRIIGLKGRMSPHVISNVRKALFKLRKDVPTLREVLTIPERANSRFSGIA